MKKYFDPQTKAKAAGETRVLLMDGHSSHYTADLLEYCLENNIEVIGYPPHCTHALQGLDVVCFAKMKVAWKEEINAFEELHKRSVDKADFCGVFGQAYVCAFTKENVEAAFAATGIHPFNLNVVKPEQMKPAEATSMQSSFPLPQPSPVHAMIAACRNHEFTYQECYPDSPPIAGPSTFPGSLLDDTIDPVLRSTPKHRIDAASNPDLATPSKHMHYLAAGLANTSSGSILISKACASHLQMSKPVTPPVVDHVPRELEEPNWSLLSSKTASALLSREELEKRVDNLKTNFDHSHKLVSVQRVINEGANAQMAIMALTNTKLNQSLYVKETRKKTDRTVMYPGGKGRHLTAVEVIAQKRKLEQEKEKEEAEKEQRKAARGNRKAEKERLELEWKEMLEDYAHQVVEWEENCKKLCTQGMMVKDLPKKPKWLLKPKPKEVEDDNVDGDDEDDGDGDGDGDGD
jgi:DDE superfamily endonuclease